MLCSAGVLCWARPSIGRLCALRGPVLHASAAPPMLWVRPLLARLVAVLGCELRLPPSFFWLWFGSRRRICRRNLLAAVLWLGSRPRGGRCNLYALMCCSVLNVNKFCVMVLFVCFDEYNSLLFILERAWLWPNQQMHATMFSLDCSPSDRPLICGLAGDQTPFH